MVSLYIFISGMSRVGKYIELDAVGHQFEPDLTTCCVCTLGSVLVVSPGIMMLFPKSDVCPSYGEHSPFELDRIIRI